MKRSLVYDESKPKIENRAIGYRANGGLADYEILTTGAGGIFSTVEDLYRWDRALYTENLVPNATLQRAFTPFKLTNGKPTDYGYGWGIGQQTDGKTVSHAGSLAGYRTLIERQLGPEHTIIMLTNGGDSFAERDIKMAINNILHNKPFELP